MNVIVIDDDPDTVEVFSEYLNFKGAKVIARGRNGKEAVELYKKHTPDIIFCDIMMPKYDGFYAVKKILKFDPNAKIILVTADLSTDTEKKIANVGVSAVVFKPYDIDKVMNTAEDVLHSKSFSEPVVLP